MMVGSAGGTRGPARLADVTTHHHSTSTCECSVEMTTSPLREEVSWSWFSFHLQYKSRRQHRHAACEAHKSSITAPTIMVKATSTNARLSPTGKPKAWATSAANSQTQCCMTGSRWDAGCFTLFTTCASVARAPLPLATPLYREPILGCLLLSLYTLQLACFHLDFGSGRCKLSCNRDWLCWWGPGAPCLLLLVCCLRGSLIPGCVYTAAHTKYAQQASCLPQAPL